MTTFVLIAIALLVIAALERSNRRQSPGSPGLRGSFDHEDRDWARTKLDLLALGGQAEPFTHKPLAVKGSGSRSAGGSRHSVKPQRPRWNTNHHNDPRAA